MYPKKKAPEKSHLLTIFFHLIFISLGVYYNYDVPQLYEAQIISKFKITTEQLDYLYSSYSIPNFFILIFATPLISKIGLGFTALTTNFLVFIAALLVYTAFYTNNFVIFVIARAFAGAGAEMCVISVYTIAERWYKGKFLSFAQGCCRALSFAAMSFSFYFGPQFYFKTRNMNLSLFFCGLVAFFGTLASVGYYIWEKIFFRTIDLDLKEEGIRESMVKSKASGIKENKKKVDFSLKQVKQLKGLFWLLALLFGFGCQGYYQFIGFATDCFIQRYGYTFEEAKNKLTLIPLISMILMPIFSGLIVKIGKKGFVLLLSFSLFLLNFLLMLSYPETPGNYIYAIIGLISVAYCLFVATIWPCMTLSAPSKATSVALGFGLNIQNLFLTAMPLIFGQINLKRDVKAYNNSLRLLCLIMILSIFLNIVVIYVDFKTGKLIHLPENDERVALIRQEMEDDES